MSKKTMSNTAKMNKEDKKLLENEVLNLLREATIYAHKELIEEINEIVYKTRVIQSEEDFEFSSKSCINYLGMTISQSLGTFFIEFEATNELNKTLKEHGFPTQFTVYLMNKKFRENIYLDEDVDLHELFFATEFTTPINLNEINRQSQLVVSEINKLILLNKIKYA